MHSYISIAILMLDWLIYHSPLLYLTQSFWRDEAFSVLFSQRPISWILAKLSFETPLYYVLLKIWMMFFGTSEIAVRSLSLVGFGLATLVVIVWAGKLFRKSWLSWFLPLFFFLNPMLLYYAFEARAYGWYMFFATLSFYSYFEKKWGLFILATVLGFYTHSYFLIVPFTQAIHYLLTNNIKLNQFKTLKRDQMARSLLVIGLILAPWLIKIASEAGKLRQSWYYKVDFNLIRSVLGNLFIGYEGTPWYLWNFTNLLSIALLVLFILALSDKTHRKRNMFFALMVFVPLISVIGVSFFKPLYVNRYVIPVTIAQVFLVVFALQRIKNPLSQRLMAFIFLVFVFGINIWYPSKHPKLPIRDTLVHVNALLGDQDVILAKSPLIFFETIYYSKNPDRVYLYNPTNSAFPWYVGDVIVSPDKIVGDMPPYPIRAFLIDENGEYEIAFQTALPLTTTPAALDK